MSKKLWILEKPKNANAVAAELPKPHVRKDGYIETGDGIVTWLFGHILEQQGPAEYDEKYKRWDIDTLPVFPEKWELKPIQDKVKQFKVVASLIKQCDVIINGGDTDREGQLLVDEVIDYLKVKKPCLRLLLQAIDPVSVRKAITNLKDNKDYVLFKESALGRQRADWLIGMNMTMGLTSLAQKQQNYGSVLSLGRVQTPTLALVVQRDLEIENFKPETYYVLNAEFLGNDMKFWTRWIPQGKSLEQIEKEEKIAQTGEYEDDDEDDKPTDQPAWLKDSKIIDPKKAQEIFDKVKNSGVGVISNYKKVAAKEFQPLPYNLNNIQSKVSLKYGHSIDQILEACQFLYEHAYTTYPRTESNYLPTSQFADSKDILNSIKSRGLFEDLIDGADTTIKTACWNDDKVAEHHAIIPTSSAPDVSSLTLVQKHTYEEIVKSYIALFYPECLVDRTKIEVTIAEERFSTSGRVVKSLGWRVVFGSDVDKQKEPTLPELSQGQNVKLTDLKKEEKLTTPPARYTEASLLNTMTNIRRVLKDPEERKQLKDSGLGRSATRTGIIKTLKNRGFLSDSGKYIISTDIGRKVIQIAPKAVSSPSLTAQWEKALDMVFEGKFPLADFEKKQQEFVTMLLNELRKSTLPSLPETSKSYSGGKGSYSKPSSSGTKSAGKKCPSCKKGNLVSKKITKGDNAGKSFKGCSNYPECKYTEWPKPKATKK